MTPLRIVLVYASFGAAWILFSDHALAILVSDAARRGRAQTVKGAAFVLVTAVLLFVVRSKPDALNGIIVGGVVVLFGSPCFAWPGAAVPQAGGDYVYLSRGLGPVWAFFVRLV